jgi:hypothetical protein
MDTSDYDPSAISTFAPAADNHSANHNSYEPDYEPDASTSNGAFDPTGDHNGDASAFGSRAPSRQNDSSPPAPSTDETREGDDEHTGVTDADAAGGAAPKRESDESPPSAAGAPAAASDALSEMEELEREMSTSGS